MYIVFIVAAVVCGLATLILWTSVLNLAEKYINNSTDLINYHNKSIVRILLLWA